MTEFGLLTTIRFNLDMFFYLFVVVVVTLNC